jgi:hypothetical protein
MHDCTQVMQCSLHAKVNNLIVRPSFVVKTFNVLVCESPMCKTDPSANNVIILCASSESHKIVALWHTPVFWCLRRSQCFILQIHTSTYSTTMSGRIFCDLSKVLTPVTRPDGHRPLPQDLRGNSLHFGGL